MEQEEQGEHAQHADRMEEDADRMEEHSEQLGERIDEIEADWEQKEQDPAVPGAQPDPDEDEDEKPVPGVQADEELASEEGGP
jgi:hypothetical protein